MPDDTILDEFDFSPHALRLGGRECLWVIAIVLAFALLAPRLWTMIERFEPADDYRVPYALSDDYWLYERHLHEAAADTDAIFVIGDSVVWGEYVKRDGTLSHFLSAASGGEHRFVNAGINGLFPLALEGLVREFGDPIAGRKVLLHANLLWMSSPEADLSTAKERKFNHEPLVPQFAVRIPCYRASVDRRLGLLAQRKVGLLAWTKHFRVSYFDQVGIPAWTLEPGNAYRNPLAAIAAGIPGEPGADPERGESSARHHAWSEDGRKPQRFDWVAPERSLQLAAFGRLVNLLRARGNDVLVVVGPFNEHMIAPGNAPGFEALRHALQAWLDVEQVAHVSPRALPSGLYGDASHPLTPGYRALAEDLLQTPEFQNWLSAKGRPLPNTTEH